MYLFTNGSILSTPSRFVRKCKMNIRNCHSRKIYHVRCHINWVLDFHFISYLNPYFLLIKSREKYRRLIIKIQCVYQILDNVMINQRVHYFHDLCLFFFYGILDRRGSSWNVMDQSWLHAIGHVYKSKQRRLYVHKKSK